MLTELMQLDGRGRPRRELRPSTPAVLDSLPYPAFVTDAEGMTAYSNRSYQA